MRCEEIKDLVFEYPDGDLTQDERFRVETHLKECRECSLFLKQANGVWNLLDRWDGIEPQGDFVAAFWDKVAEEDLKKRGGILDFFRNLNLGWQVVVAVATILIVSFIALNVFQSDVAKVIVTETDRRDEELLMKLDKDISRGIPRSLRIYGPWKTKDEGIKEG